MTIFYADTEVVDENKYVAARVRIIERSYKEFDEVEISLSRNFFRNNRKEAEEIILRGLRFIEEKYGCDFLSEKARKIADSL